MPRSGLAVAVLAVGVLAVVCFVWTNDNAAADVILEETEPEINFIKVPANAGSKSYVGAIAMGSEASKGCLEVKRGEGGATDSVTFATCQHGNKLQEFSYIPSSGLIQAPGKDLCLHADFVSEPEGALMSVQHCKEESKRQKFKIDSSGSPPSVMLQATPELCLKPMSDAAAKESVFVLKCQDSPLASSMSTLSVLAGDLDLDEKKVTKKQEKAVAKKPVVTKAAKPEVPKTDAVPKQAAPEVQVQDVAKKPVVTKVAKPEVPKTDAVPKQAAPEMQVQDVATAQSTMEAKSAAALARIQSAVEERRKTDSKAKRQARDAKDAGDKVAKKKADDMLLQAVSKEKMSLRSVVTEFEQQYKAEAAQAKSEAENAKKLAKARAETLQGSAKLKAKMVIAKSRKKLHQTLVTSLATLTDSTDKRQTAKAKLVKLRSGHADEVELAEAALTLAKVNKETGRRNMEARNAARLARMKAKNEIKFAKTMLASQLKAIHSTANLRTDEAELSSRGRIAASQELLSRTKQQVLMALDAADASIPLDEVVGKEDVVGLDQVEAGPGSPSTDFDQTESDVEGLEEEDLVGDRIVHAAQDTIFTEKMSKCKFPFISDGEKFYHCRRSEKGHWCATEVDPASKEVKSWDYCVLNKHAVQLAQQAAMTAAQLEIKRVLTETGAKLTPAVLQESLRAASAAQQTPVAASSAPASSAQTSTTPDVWAKGRDEAKRDVDQMIEADSQQPKKL